MTPEEIQKKAFEPMKANELMQGYIVLYEYDGQKFPARVIEIYRNSVLVESINGEYEPIEIEEDKIFPVSLTPEILEKNGFRKGSYVGGYYSLECPFRVFVKQVENCEFSVLFDEEIHFSCTYVHQLQHALRLCGIDKEIEI